MVNIVRLMQAVHNLQKIIQKADNINLGQMTNKTVRQTRIGKFTFNISLPLIIPNQTVLALETANTVLQLFLHLITANIAQVITLMVKEKAMQQRTRRINRRRLSRTQTAVNFQQCLINILRRVFLQSFGNRLMVVKQRQYFLIGFIAQ